MFKCCVCHGKTSRRTSTEEEDEEDESSSKDVDDEGTSSSSSSSSSSTSSSSTNDDEDEEERKIEEELAQKFKCPDTQAAVPVTGPKETLAEVNEEEVERVVVEVNGVDREVIREAMREEVVEILNNAAKIANDIRGKGELLEKIKEESGEESTGEATPKSERHLGTPPPPLPLENGEDKPELGKGESEETEEEVVTVIEEDDEDEGEYVVEDEEAVASKAVVERSKIEEMIIEELINEVNDETEELQELKEIVESQKEEEEEVESAPETGGVAADDEETAGPPEGEEQSLPPPPTCEVEIVDELKKSDVHRVEDHANGGSEEKEEEVEQRQPETDLLNIPPPSTPPPEEAADFERLDEARARLDFPTPPPIDFDVAETDREDEGEDDEGEDETDEEYGKPGLSGPPAPPPWEDEGLRDYLPVVHQHSGKPCPSPGSKSLPSPPSPGSETDAGNETEAESSRSSGDEQTVTTKMTVGGKLGAPPVGLVVAKKAYIERTIDDGPDEDGDDSVFETESLAKDGSTEDVKDLPPRPVPPVPRWLSQEEDEPETSCSSEGLGGMQDPPNTPIARDELAMRRHRFFSDLLQAARSTAEHRVSFDPLGPLVHPGCDHDEREEHLEELVNRLESVTKRLEQVTSTSCPHHQSQAHQSSGTSVVRTTQEIAVQTKSPSPERSLSLADEPSQSSSASTVSSAPSVVEVVKSMSLAAYEDIIAGPLQNYVKISQKIGGLVAEHSALIEKAFKIQLEFLKTAASRPAPSDSELVALLAPTSKQISAVLEYREKNRGSDFFNHLSAVGESVLALGWVTVAATPAPHIKEMSNSAQFYINRVRMEWKEKDKTHVEWCEAWVKILTDLHQFVKQHHTTGLVWAKSWTGPPPPPPPSMMPMPEPVLFDANDDRSALFAEINQGENITKNLKKVTSDMQTHKNASLRTGPAPFKAPVVSNSSPGKTSLPANAPIDKPPVFTRDGKKWIVENHKGNQNLVIDNTEMNNVVYIFRCQDSAITVKGKINSVVMDSCRKSAIVVDSVVASIEFVNCQSVQMQVFGKIPTISIDKTDGCQMYLNKESLDVELITSKSSEMNVLLPDKTGEDYVELPVPEQFKTRINEKGLKLSTTAVESK
ncbi:histone acetyltransferase KAT6B [Copidosoma floridanum]|uniref:histone acetyltransferase KAT6B n=1 Tax=Copidosoma floridanum TaxID=29053 RepID=UPI0006C9D6AF|nr:histone acetyltransferase KAT6B [Copidosoma floridanum]